DLAREGATVLVHGREDGRIAATVAEVAAAAGGADRVRSYQADLSSLAAVRALADQVTEAEPHLDVLVNNAGIGVIEPGGGFRQESADGLELRFAVNYLAGYALSRYLLPLLTRSAPARIVNVASVGQQAIDFDDVMLTREYDGMRAYRQSKLAQIMNTFDLADELKAAGVTVNALHPATLRLITEPPERTGTGRYFDGQTESRANDQAYDPEARRQLRTLSDQLTAR